MSVWDYEIHKTSLADWLHVMDGANYNMTWKVMSFKDLMDALGVINAKPLSTGERDLENPGRPWFVMGGGSSGSSGLGSTSTTTQTSVLSPLLMTAAAGAAGSIALQVKAGAVTSASGSVLNAGGFLLPPKVAIMAVAGACGLSIGGELAQDIEKWMAANNFDWGPDSIQDRYGLTKILSIAVKEGQHAKTFLSQDLILRVVNALDEWGLWDAPPSIEPLQPVIGEARVYEFRNRFPNIPEGYVDRCQKIIDNYEIEIGGKYIIVGVAEDNNLRMTVFSSNNLNIRMRDAKVNEYGIFSPGDKVCQVMRGGLECYVDQYDITENGVMTQIMNHHSIDFLPFTLYSGDTHSAIFDNFGTYYRELHNGKIGSATDALNAIARDLGATDLRQGTIPDTMPEWWGDRINVSTPDTEQWPRAYPVPDYLNNTKPFLPVRVVDGKIDQDITQRKAIEDTPDDDVVEDVIDETEEAVPDIGVPKDPSIPPVDPPQDTPEIPTMTGSPVSDTGMISLYNPTTTELTSFSSWLWSFNFDTTIKKLLQDPMEAIIGLHQIYATPNKKQNAKADIIVGRIPSGVEADLVKQYTTIDCKGNGYPLYIQPWYKNIHDYIDTRIQLFLPFIGMVDLDVAEVMGKYINVIYKIDFLTGTCLALVTIQKSLDSQTIYTGYTFAGNCAVQLPITGANYSGILANIIGVATTIATAGAGSLAGAAIAGGATLATGSQMHIQHSGSVGANAGAMGIKKPYIVITRNEVADALDKGHYEGLPNNLTTRLGAMSGYTRVKKINLENMPCSEHEKDLILAKLQEGVFI